MVGQDCEWACTCNGTLLERRVSVETSASSMLALIDATICVYLCRNVYVDYTADRRVSYLLKIQVTQEKEGRVGMSE